MNTNNSLVAERQEPLVIFLHIPKTAGSTLNAILKRNYGEEHSFRFAALPSKHRRQAVSFNQLPLEERLQYKLLTGHVPYGVHRQIQDPSVYFTILRNPVDRVISYYYFVKRTKGHYLYEKVATENLSLLDCLSLKVSDELDNGQVRFLIGKPSYKVPFGECPDEYLKIAKSRLKHHFLVVGTAERFDETLLLLKNRLGWPMPFYVKVNVTKNRPMRDKVPDDIREKISQINHLDGELYKFANQLLDEAIKEHVKYFKLNLFLFRLANFFYNLLYQFSSLWPTIPRKWFHQKIFGL